MEHPVRHFLGHLSPVALLLAVGVSDTLAIAIAIQFNCQIHILCCVALCLGRRISSLFVCLFLCLYGWLGLDGRLG